MVTTKTPESTKKSSSKVAKGRVTDTPKAKGSSAKLKAQGAKRRSSARVANTNLVPIVVIGVAVVGVVVAIRYWPQIRQAVGLPAARRPRAAMLMAPAAVAPARIPARALQAGGQDFSTTMAEKSPDVRSRRVVTLVDPDSPVTDV